MNKYYQNRLPLLFLLFIFTFSPLYTSAQRQNVVDSLLIEIKNSTSDSLNIISYLNIANIYQEEETNTSLKYAKKALAIAEDNNYSKKIVSIRRIMASMLAREGKIDTARTYILKALETCRKEKLFKQMPHCLNNLGLIHYKLGNWDEAMKCFNEGFFINEDLPDNNKQISINLLNNIGIIFSEQKNYEQANTYYLQVLEMTREINDSSGISIALTNIGEIFYSLKEPEKALKYYTEALTISQLINDTYGIGFLYTNIAVIHSNRGKFELAEEYLFKAMKIASKLNAPSEKSRIYLVLSEVEQNKKKYANAIEYAKKGLVIAKKIKSKIQIKISYETLSENYKLQKRYKEALAYHKLFKTINDTLFNEEKSRQIAELSIQYETRKKEGENQFLKEEQAKNEALLERRATLNWTIFLFLVLVSVIAYNLFINNRRKEKYNVLLEEKVEERTKELKNSNAKLKRSNSDLEQFAYITSHDLKEPLRNIMSFTSLIARNLGNSLDEQSKEHMSIVQTNVSQMGALIEGVLSYARIKDIDYDNEQVDLNQIISKLKVVLNIMIKENNVILSTGNLHTVSASSPQIFIVLKNLVENAIKYNTQQPNIHISSKKVGEMYHIEVKDNGIGINEEYQSKIFTIFKRLHSRTTYDGVGVGLSTCKKITQNLGGDIWVESEEGEGSRFIFAIPA